VRFDVRAFLIAIVLALVLAVLGVFGGPHGALGGWPWLFNLPGLAIIYLIPGNELFGARVLAALLIQVTLWYFIVSALRRRRSLARPS
jgi:hypothetical protein